MGSVAELDVIPRAGPIHFDPFVKEHEAVSSAALDEAGVRLRVDPPFRIRLVDRALPHPLLARVDKVWICRSPILIRPECALLVRDSPRAHLQMPRAG